MGKAKKGRVRLTAEPPTLRDVYSRLGDLDKVLKSPRELVRGVAGAPKKKKRV